MAITNLVAKAIVLDEGGKFLLLTRSDTHPTLAGFYDLPGGMVEPGEEPGAAVRREIHEETGLSVTDARILYATTMLINNVSYPTLLYRVKVPGTAPSVEVSWEHQAFEWSELHRLQEVEPQLAPTYRQALDYIRKNDILTECN
jgi:8-oxo-dGTP pyrophosphatase MutT (NUDIX family)